ncbi:MAG: ATP-binding protein [Candidatus Omnitrophota bacterium]|nr:ATP-binding protein [Candidatus Omnitrophota bacterium]
MSLNLFSFAGLVLSSTCFILMSIILLYGKKYIHYIWALFNIAVGIWGVGAFLVGQASSEPSALLRWKIAHIGIIFIPIFVFHLSYILCEIRKKYLLIIIYAQGIIFLILNFINHFFISGVRLVFSSFYYLVPGIFYYPFFSIWVILVLYAHYELFLAYRKSKGLLRSQILYLFCGTILGFLGGITNFFPVFKIDIYPIGNFTIPLYCLIVTYAILRYRLMDIRVFISRAVAFLISYSLLLIVPFFFAYRMYPVLQPYLGINWWLAPVGLLIFFATIAPIAYDQIRRGMEERLLAAQKRYQKLLLQAASGMVREHSLGHLSKLIVHIVKRAVKIDFVAMFLENREQKVYQLKAIRDSGSSSYNITFLAEHPFIDYLKANNDPVLYEELPFQLRNSLNLPLQISLIIPSAIEGNLLGFLVLGEKLNREPYSEDDINVFKILSHQAAMAIENCLFFEEFKSVQQKIFTAEKLASIGGMADGVAHQIKNRLNHFSIATGEMQCEINDFIEKHPQVMEQNPDLKKSFEYILSIASSMIDNVKRTDGVVKGILGYARVEEKETFFSEFPLNEILAMSLDLIKIKHEVAEIPLECEIGSDDTLYGVKAQIMECIFNLLDNHYEAVMEKRNKLGDEEKLQFTPSLKLKLIQKPHSCRIEVSDNGIGIKDEDKLKIFAPFFTTKSSYKSGSGIGIYVVKRIVEENHKGKIWFESTYMQGTKFIMEIPKK